MPSFGDQGAFWRCGQPMACWLLVQSNITMSNSKGTELSTFRRIEKKFVLSRDEGEGLLRLISERVPPSYPGNNTSFYDVESVYFDSTDLDIFRTHFKMMDGRFKLRTRTYGPNGIWDRSCVFLEMKIKRGEVTEKYRIKLDPTSQSMLFESDEPQLSLSRALMMMNPSVEFRDLSNRVQQVDRSLRRLKLKPCSRLYYRRKAFENDEIRITFDENIRTELLLDVPPATRMEIFASPLWPEAQRMTSEHPISRGRILEIKNEGSLPDWLADFFRANGTKEARFSKFCYAIASNLGGAIGTSLSQADITPDFRSVAE